MVLTLMEFFNIADKLLPKSFSGDSSALSSFIDSLNLLKLNCTGHEENALNFVKTRLTGKARLAVTDDVRNLDGIIAVLKEKCKGEKSHTIEARLLNIKQDGKDAASFTQQIDDLASNLLAAYVKEGVRIDTAETFVKNRVVQALVANARSEKTKLVIEAGTFKTLQDVLIKFVSVDTDTTNASVMYANTSRCRSYFYKTNNNNNSNHVDQDQDLV